MRATFGAAALACALLAGGGCANFTYLQKTPDGGVVKFKAGEQKKVEEQLKKEHGDIEVIGVTDATSVSPGAFDPNAPIKPSDRMMAQSDSFTSIFGKSDFGQMQLTYRKVALPGGTTGTTPAGVQQAGYQSKSVYERPGMGTRLPEPSTTFGDMPASK